MWEEHWLEEVALIEIYITITYGEKLVSPPDLTVISSN